MNSFSKRWQLQPETNPELVRELGAALNVGSTIATLLVQRGITTFDKAKAFFRPSLEDLHDPFLMKDMDAAVRRIWQAVGQNEKILVYGDYDVDGTSAVALLYSFFRHFYPDNTDFYIPDRYTEGYGISFRGIDWAEEQDISLIIALDCGIRSVDKINYALEKNIDFIICDHHLPGEDLPRAAAILNPKRPDCPYPYKELCGCGIGFKLAQALNRELNLSMDEQQWLDLVALAIAADIVPVTGENRVLAWYGLKQINEQPRPGIRALLRPIKEDAVQPVGSKADTADIPRRDYTISDLVFTAAPRINAAGRIDHGKKAVELLISENETLAAEAGLQINASNSRRKDLDQQMTAEALAMIEWSPARKQAFSTVLYSDRWHKGVAGIVASRVLETWYKPTVILTSSNGYITGSARSVHDFDIHRALESCSDLLEQFGGHKYAAGLTLKPENLEPFSRRFEEYVARTIRDDQRQAVIHIDLEIEPDEITPKFYRVLKQLAPFGPGNMAPVFLTRGLTDDGYGRIVGSKHLKLRLGKPGMPYYEAIAFGMGQFQPQIAHQIPCDACYSVEENHWNGTVRLQWVIKDMRF